MTADVNVTEKARQVQRRERGEAWDVLVPEEGWTVGRIVEDAIETTLDTLADPEVLAEIAGVLAEHRHDVISYDAWSLDGCDCGWTPTDPYSDNVWDQHRAHQAAAVVEWLAGGRP